MGTGVFRRDPQIRRHGGVRDLTWRQPRAFVGFNNIGIGSLSFTGFSLLMGASPPAVLGDTFIVQARTMPGNYTVTVANDGTFVIASGGDSSRQSFTYSLFRRASGITDGPATVWINELGPSWGQKITIQQVLLPIPAPIDINLAGAPYATSPEGDALVFSYTGTLPPNVVLTPAGRLFGPLDAIGDFVFTLIATDLTGTSGSSLPNEINVVASTALNANADGFRRHRAGPKRHRIPDWQSISRQEAEKIRRLDRKRQAQWEAQGRQLIEQLEEITQALEPPGMLAARPPIDPRLVEALSGHARMQDDHDLHALLAQEHAAFIAFAQRAMSLL